MTILNAWTSAQIQLSVDAANAELVDYLSKNAPPNSLVLINIQRANEYVAQIEVQLNNVQERADITVEPFDFQHVNPADQRPYLIATPHIANFPVLTVRLGVVDSLQEEWNASLDKYMQESGGSWKQVFQTNKNFRQTSTDITRMLCPFRWSNSYCAIDRPIVDTRTFTYGWAVYALDTP